MGKKLLPDVAHQVPIRQAVWNTPSLNSFVIVSAIDRGVPFRLHSSNRKKLLGQRPFLEHVTLWKTSRSSFFRIENFHY